MSAPITSSQQMVGVLQQQLADIAQQKSVLIAKQASVIAAGMGPQYTISGPTGSETLGTTDYLRFLGDQVKAFAELEMQLLEMLQDLQPFTLIQPVGRHCGMGYGCSQFLCAGGIR